MANKFKTIGILGGMGPLAGATMFTELLKQAQKDYGAEQDNDYPRVILYSNPLESFDEKGQGDDAEISAELTKGIKVLEHAGAELIVVACNTVHKFYTEKVLKNKNKFYNIYRIKLFLFLKWYERWI